MTSSSDGVTWANAWAVPNIAIGSQPALATVNGKLYVAWRADDPSNAAWIASSSDGVNFSSLVLSGQTMGESSSPALAVAGTTLYYIYGANDAANEMLVTTTSDGSSWQGPSAYLNVRMGVTGPAATWYSVPALLNAAIQSIQVGFQADDARNILYVEQKLCSSNACP